jgi:hypothetical protein
VKMQRDGFCQDRLGTDIKREVTKNGRVFIMILQDVKWDNCQPPYSPGNCTPAPFSGGHNYTGWCGDKPCPVNSKEGVGATVAAALNDGGIDYNCGPLYKTQLYNALQVIERTNGAFFLSQMSHEERSFTKTGSGHIERNTQKTRVVFHAARRRYRGGHRPRCR